MFIPPFKDSTVSRDCPFCGCGTISIVWDGEIGYAECTYCLSQSPMVSLDDKRIFFYEEKESIIKPFQTVSDYIVSLNLPPSYELTKEDIRHFITSAWCLDIDGWYRSLEEKK